MPCQHHVLTLDRLIENLIINNHCYYFLSSGSMAGTSLCMHFTHMMSHLTFPHKSRRQILLSPPILTGGKNKAHRGETSCLKSHSSTLQSDSKDRVCGYCTLLTCHVAVIYKAPRASMNKKTWFLTQRSFHALHTSFLVSVMLSLQHTFLLSQHS